MPHAIRIHQHGGPDVMTWEEIPTPTPGPKEALLRQTAVGLNYIDVLQRNGAIQLDLPSCIGMEGVGVVETVGPDVEIVKPGDRVAYVMGPPGSYTQSRVYPAERLIPLPDDITDAQAAAMMLKGLTAAYLVRRTFQVGPEHSVLFHAAAGGVGLIACQWLKKLGANVIGTVGSDDKAKLSKQYGCDHVINYTRENFADRVNDITDGKGVNVVYDGVGAATYEGSLQSLAPFGTYVLIGAASGAAPAVPGTALAPKALYFTRPGLAPHTATRALTLDIANALFEAIRAGLKIEINQTFSLQDAAKAHEALENRRTTGSTILTIA